MPGGEPDGELLSPPREWPECFSTPELKSYVNTTLKGKRVRLTDRPEVDEVARVRELELCADDSRGNAVKVRRALGWPIVAGFALYEKAAGGGDDGAGGGKHSRYTSKQRWWNATPKGVWYDFSPRSERKLVLIESTLTAVPEPSAEELESLAHPSGGAAETVVVVRHLDVSARYVVKEKHLGRPIKEVVLDPFVKSYNAKCLGFVETPFGPVASGKNAELMAAQEGHADNRRVPISLDRLRRLVLADERGHRELRDVKRPTRDEARRGALLRCELEVFGGDEPECVLLRKVGTTLPAFLGATEWAFSGKSLTPDDMRVLAELVRSHGPLHSVANLYLYSNWLQDAGLEHLVSILPLLPGLKSVFLHNNQITSKGVEALCLSPPATELTELSLWANQVDDGGFVALARAIERKALRLRSLTIHQNPAGQRAKDALQAAGDDVNARIKVR